MFQSGSIIENPFGMGLPGIPVNTASNEYKIDISVHRPDIIRGDTVSDRDDLVSVHIGLGIADRVVVYIPIRLAE